MAKSPRIYTKVGPFTFAYPHLTSPDTVGPFADNKYKVNGIAAPTTDAMKAAKAEVENAVKTLGVAKGSYLPLKKEMAKGEDGEKAPTGNLLFRSKSQYAPAIVDASGRPIPEKTLKNLKIGAGSEGLLEGYFSSYEGANAGMSFTLTGVQLIKLVSNSGSASFGAYAGGGFTVEDDGGADLDDDVADDTGQDANDDDGGLDI